MKKQNMLNKELSIKKSIEGIKGIRVIKFKDNKDNFSKLAIIKSELSENIIDPLNFAIISFTDKNLDFIYDYRALKNMSIRMIQEVQEVDYKNNLSYLFNCYEVVTKEINAALPRYELIYSCDTVDDFISFDINVKRNSKIKNFFDRALKFVTKLNTAPDYTSVEGKSMKKDLIIKIKPITFIVLFGIVISLLSAVFSLIFLYGMGFNFIMDHIWIQVILFIGVYMNDKVFRKCIALAIKGICLK